MATSWPPTPDPGPKADEAAIARFEQAIGTRLPEEYRLFLAEVNGGRPTKAHRTFRLRRGETTLNSLFSLEHSTGGRNLAERNETIRDDLPPELISIGSDDGGARILLCISGEHRGEVWYMDTIDRRSEGANPRVLWHDRRDMIRLADNFRAFMASLTPL